MPVPGTPFEMMPDSWASVRCRTLALPEMSTALSLPLPSSPWQPAQEELYMVRPRSVVALKRPEEGICCPNEDGMFKTHSRRQSPGNGNSDLRIVDISRRPHSISASRSIFTTTLSYFHAMEISFD